MSPALGQSPGRAHRAAGRHLVLAHATIPARVHPAPGDAATAQIVILDSSLVPVSAHFAEWAAQLSGLGFERMRTGALAPRQALQAELAGLHCIQELALLEASSPFAVGRPSVRTRRGTRRRTVELADIDRAAFGDAWRLDAAMLDDVRSATPASRCRIVPSSAIPSVGRPAGATTPAGRVAAGFLISGRAGRNGYIQRLAVEPTAQRRGVATALLSDALRWLRRRKVERVFVNTHVANEPALRLYRAHGFSELPDRLRVFEGSTRP